MVAIIGLTRFSYLGDGGFQTEHASLDERRAYLYDPVRLESRFAWFEHVTLPAISAQTDADFRLILLSGVDFPQKERLKELTAHIPQIECVFAPPARHRAACRSVLANFIPEDQSTIQFRLDDDDAISVEFVARLRSDKAQSDLLCMKHGKVAFDYQKGLILSANGSDVSCEGHFARYWGCGLAVAFAEGQDGTIVDFAHHTIWKNMPTVTFMDSPMWVRGVHGLNDSGAPKNTLLWNQQPANTDWLLADRFKIDRRALKRRLRQFLIARDQSIK